MCCHFPFDTIHSYGQYLLLGVHPPDDSIRAHVAHIHNYLNV